MIWIAGGTHETRELLEMLKNYEDILITVATNEGAKFLPSDANFLVGPVLRETIPDFVKKHNIDLIIDLTHPFADRITESLQIMSDRLEIPLVRFVRGEKTVEDDRIIYAENYEDAFKIISKLSGTFLFATGSKRADEFLQYRGENRFVFRILPAVSSVKFLTESGVKINDIIAMVGPFSYNLNKALLESVNADYIVTKDSGEGSGTDEKLRAAMDTGVVPIVIKRNIEEGETLEDIVKIIGGYRDRKNN